MSPYFTLKPHHVHLWRVCLSDFFQRETAHLAILSEDEIARANRFKFPQHRQRFIAARALLRQILSLYTGLSAEKILFHYSARGKPYLKDTPFELEFNVSHSHEAAVYAVSVRQQIGVDIEKMTPDYHGALAERFFHEEECQVLMQLPTHLRSAAFYQLWACKEAVLKAVGEGLHLPLKEVVIDLNQSAQRVCVRMADKMLHYHVARFWAYTDYQAAFAVSAFAAHTEYWEWGLQGFQPFSSPIDSKKRIENEK